MKMSPRRNSRDRRLMTATFKHIGLGGGDAAENQEETQFAEIIAKQSTLDKVNALEFENDTVKCRNLLDSLLTEYDLFHPPTQSTLCGSTFDAHNQTTIQDPNQQNDCMDTVKQQQEDSVGVDETQNSNIKLKSNIIFLELQQVFLYSRNQKLSLKFKLLQKKLQKHTIQLKMAPKVQLAFRQREKQLLETQLSLLNQLKNLTQELDKTKTLKYNANDKATKNLKKISQKEPETKKKLNKTKLLQYLLSKAEACQSQQSFMQILNKTSQSLYSP